MNKRILSVTLILSLILSLCTFNITANAAIGIEHEEQVSKLNAFGILTGYPNTSYDAGGAVSASDFVGAAYRLAGIDGDFTDAMAQKFGFKADDKTIAVQTAVAVLFNALGYGYEADAMGGYPNGYTRLASSTGILNGTASAATDNLTNDAMAVLLYNALELDAIETNNTSTYRSDETVMEKLDIYKGKGIVTATQYASMSGYDRTGRDSIKIDSEDYSLGRTYADNLFGYSVEFYYNEDNELLWIDARSNMTVARVAEIDIISLDENGITFTNENEKRKTYSYNDAVFVYNGKAVINPDFERFKPQSGYVYVIDNNNDGKAEVVSCESYEYYLVSEKNTNAETINDYETGKSVSLSTNDYDNVKILKNGALISFDDIQQNDVVAVMKSDDSNGIVKAVVSTYSPVSGSVKSTSTQYIKIDNDVYDISTAYEGSTLSTGKSGTFYLDINGNIVRFIKEGNSTSKYAYLISAYIDDNGEDCYVQILTAGNSVEEHKIRRKVTYNDESITAKTLCDRLLAGGSTARQLITYSLNSNGEISKITTANKNNMYSGTDNVTDRFSQYFQGHGRYRKNNLCFNQKYLIDADTPIFVVPSSREKEDYEVRYAASLTNGTSYYISVYDIDEYMTAGAIVLDEVASDPEQLKSKRCIIIDSISSGVNEDDEPIVIVEGYQQGSQVTLETKDEPFLKDSEGRYYSLGRTEGFTELSRGDIIQTSLDANGKLLAFRTLYKADAEKKKLVMASNDTPNEYEEGGNVNDFSDLFILHGTVKARSSNILVVESDTKRAHKITNGCNVYLVEGRGVEKVTTSDIHKNDEIYLHTYQGNLQDVVIYR